MNEKTEKILIELIHFMADKFKDKAVLEGGMLLRLFNSPRATQDADFLLISERSKKELASDIKKIMQQFDPASVTNVDVNSRGIFIDFEGPSAEKAILEINVVKSLHLPTGHQSTGFVARQHNLASRVVTTIALPEAYSNKIAACIERKNLRDLYDLTLFDAITDFDRETLVERLAKISIGRAKPKKLLPREASDILKKRVDDLGEDDLRDELYPVIPVQFRKGVLNVIRSTVARIIQRLNEM